MKTPDDVAEMLRLRACGWGLKRIARQLGCSHHTVKDYVAAGGVKPFKSPERPKRLDGLEDWLRERFIRHRGNADVVRQDLLAEKGVAVSRRTLQRAVQPYRQALKAEALATTRFETPPGRQLQIDFGERLVEIGGAKIKAFVFVATLGHSRRLHVRAFRAEKQEHWFAGLESAFTTFGGVPEEVLMDNPRALVVRHDAVSRSVQFNDKLIAFAKHWGFRPRACAPYRARTKGKTESGVGYVKKNAIAGHSFASWEAFEAHLAEWEREVANVRIHGTTGESADRPLRARRGAPVEAARRAAVVRIVARTEPRRQQRLRRRDRHEQLLGTVAVDRRTRGGDGRGRRGAHPPWRARGCCPQAIGGSSSADRRFRPPRRCCRSRWRCLPTGDRGADGADVVSTALVVASSCRIRSSDRRELLMARAKKATEAPTDPLDAMLARLQLSGIRDQLDNLLDEAARANLSARETLILLCEREIARKDHRRIEMALKLAHFPAVKELASFDFEAQPSIDPKQIRDLAASRWIANGENVLLLGPSEPAS